MGISMEKFDFQTKHKIFPESLAASIAVFHGSADPDVSASAMVWAQAKIHPTRQPSTPYEEVFTPWLCGHFLEPAFW